MTTLENALVWLYVKTWGKFGDHVIVEKDLWDFHDDDLETAIMGIAYPRKKSKPERIQALTDLIMERFDLGGLTAFREWSAEIHGQIIETLPEADESKKYGMKLHLNDVLNIIYYILYMEYLLFLFSNLEEVTTQQQQLLLISSELKQLEPQIKENFARLSNLTTNLLDEFKRTKIQKWDSGK